MKLIKAVELLETASEGFPVGDNSEKYYKALDLGREAIKWIIGLRGNTRMPILELLPGETEDPNLRRTRK